jgi:hypothetical protein
VHGCCDDHDKQQCSPSLSQPVALLLQQLLRLLLHGSKTSASGPSSVFLTRKQAQYAGQARTWKLRILLFTSAVSRSTAGWGAALPAPSSFSRASMASAVGWKPCSLQIGASRQLQQVPMQHAVTGSLASLVIAYLKYLAALISVLESSQTAMVSPLHSKRKVTYQLELSSAWLLPRPTSNVTVMHVRPEVKVHRFLRRGSCSLLSAQHDRRCFCCTLRHTWQVRGSCKSYHRDWHARCTHCNLLRQARHAA